MPVKSELKEMQVPLSADGRDETTIRYRTVSSNNIDWVGWPKSGEPLMIVGFDNKSVYGYLGVPRQKAVAMAWAPSSGKYLCKHIKPNYKVVRLA